MGIINIHILNETLNTAELTARAQLEYEENLVRAHRQGLHPYGEMRRDCPLCQSGK